MQISLNSVEQQQHREPLQRGSLGQIKDLKLHFLMAKFRGSCSLKILSLTVQRRKGEIRSRIRLSSFPSSIQQSSKPLNSWGKQFLAKNMIDSHFWKRYLNPLSKKAWTIPSWMQAKVSKNSKLRSLMQTNWWRALKYTITSIMSRSSIIEVEELELWLEMCFSSTNWMNNWKLYRNSSGKSIWRSRRNLQLMTIKLRKAFMIGLSKSTKTWETLRRKLKPK